MSKMTSGPPQAVAKRYHPERHNCFHNGCVPFLWHPIRSVSMTMPRATKPIASAVRFSVQFLSAICFRRMKWLLPS